MKRANRSDNFVRETTADYGAAFPKKMFSPASFTEFIRGRNPFEEATPILTSDGLLPIVSFYGLKGGSGRSLCLAYSAVLLARRGLRVGVIDFDFEAPGLHAIFDIKNAERGSLSILEDGNYRSRTLDIWQSIETLSFGSTGKVMVMTAGRIDADYLMRLDNLRPLLWNEYDSQPITRFLSAFTKDDFDLILIDCRTGFHGITASLLFHYSDLVVSLFPMSNQIWEGIEILSEAWKNARQIRGDAPEWIVVPAMVPSGKEGQKLLEDFSEKLSIRFKLESEIDEDALPEGDNRILKEGIPYHPGIATEGRVPNNFSQGGPWSIFEPLVNKIVDALAIDEGNTFISPVEVDYKQILDELEIPASDGFAEELDRKDIDPLLVPSDDLKAAIDPSMAIVVGAKGSGKTLVWRCCVEADLRWIRKNEEYAFLVGHPPTAALDHDKISISRAGFKKVETDGAVNRFDSYEQFWILYAIYRLCRKYNALTDRLARTLPPNMRQRFKTAMTADVPNLTPVLKSTAIVDSSEALLIEADQHLVDMGQEKIVLCYDGLDTYFQDVQSIQVERRNNFVKGLLLMVSEFRGRLHRLRFKVFLREDIYLSIEGLQNKSHIEAYKKELKFQSRDLWRLAMNLVDQSKVFHDYIQTTAPGLNPPWDIEEDRLKQLLNVLWGRDLGKGNKAISTNYIIKRISDSQGRLFPRTFIQMLRHAVQHARQLSPAADRVLPHQSLTRGVEEASKQRTDDLKTEYIELRQYFSAMQNMKANFDLKEFKSHVNKALKNDGEKAMTNPEKVLNQLETVGVLAKKERKDEKTWRVALMYRSGLGVKGAGLS